MQTSSDNDESEPNDVLARWQAAKKLGPKLKRKPPTFATSRNVRFGLGLYGVVVPVFCHLIPYGNAPDPALWQSGKWEDKLSFVLSVECGWPVLPFLIYAMLCMLMVTYDETYAFAKAWVRLGIFSGVFVSSWYLIAFSVSVFDNPVSSIGLLLAAGGWLLFAHGFIWFVATLSKIFDSFPLILIIIGGGIISVSAASGSTEALAGLFLWPIPVLLILSTPLAFIVYFGMSIRILKLHTPARRFTLSQLMVWVTWLTAFASALQKTISLSFDEYSRLPLQPPRGGDCYVATAASKGYPWIVKSQSLPSANNQPVIVNQQLATFKAAELTLRAISPKGHRLFRSVYNRLGPLAAAKLVGPLSATVAYLCLKPAEWLCRIVLRILLGRQAYRLAKTLYHARAEAADVDRVRDV